MKSSIYPAANRWFIGMLMLCASSVLMAQTIIPTQFTLKVPLQLELAEDRQPNDRYLVLVYCYLFENKGAATVGYGFAISRVDINPTTGKNTSPEVEVRLNVDAGKDPRQVNAYRCILRFRAQDHAASAWVSGQTNDYTKYDPSKPFVGIIEGVVNQPRIE